MKNLKIIFLFIVPLFLVSSCTKIGKNITIKGTVLNPLTGEPIPGTEIWLLKMGMGLPGAYKSVKTVYSDENGNFEINKLSLRADLLRVGNMHGSYYEIGWYKDGKYITDGVSLPIKRGKKLFVDFHAVPYGKINLDIKNVNCSGNTDTMRLRNKWQFDKDGYGNWSPFNYTGCYEQVNDGAIEVPVGKYTYQIKVKRNDIETTMEFSGIVKENELTTIQIYY